MQSVKQMSLKGKLVALGVVLLVLAVIFLINWTIYKLLGFVFGSLISFFLIIYFYYNSIRNLVRGIAFPGMTILMKRNLEFEYCKNMAQGVMRNIIDLKNSLEMFSGPVSQDVGKTELLNLGKKLTISCLTVIFQPLKR